MSFQRFSCLVVLALAVIGAAGAGSARIEGTPAPAAPKPDFSSMTFLIGTWTCSERSSRRPGPFSVTEVYSMDPSGYWIIRDLTIHKASWIPRESHSQTKYSYDAAAKRWIRVETGDRGAYVVATAPMPSGNKKVYTYVIASKAPDIASYAPEVYVKESDTKKTMTTSFTETSGRIVTVVETCTKNP